VRRVQFVQEDHDRVVVRLASDPSATDADIASWTDAVRTKFRAVMGPACDVQVERIADILPTDSGRYLYTISKVKPRKPALAKLSAKCEVGAPLDQALGRAYIRVGWRNGQGAGMASLQVNDVPDDVVAELQRRAAASNSSVEAEHRQILQALVRPKRSKQRMLEALRGLPWEDPDFVVERSRDTGRQIDL
jgi:plasmid stability protein